MSFWQTLKKIEKSALSKWSQNWGASPDDFEADIDGDMGGNVLVDDMDDPMGQDPQMRMFNYVAQIMESGMITPYPSPAELNDPIQGQSLLQVLQRAFPQNAMDVAVTIQQVTAGKMQSPQPVPGTNPNPDEGATVEDNPSLVMEDNTFAAPPTAVSTDGSKPPNDPAVGDRSLAQPGNFDNLDLRSDNKTLPLELGLAALGTSGNPTDWGKQLRHFIRKKIEKLRPNADEAEVEEALHISLIRSLGSPTGSQFDNRVNFFLARPHKLQENPALKARVDAALADKGGFEAALADLASKGATAGPDGKSRRGRKGGDYDIAKRDLFSALKDVVDDSQPGAKDGFLSQLASLMENQDKEVRNHIASQADNAARPLVMKEKQDVAVGDDGETASGMVAGDGGDYARPDEILSRQQAKDEINSKLKGLGVDQSHAVDSVRKLIENSHDMVKEVSTAMWDDMKPGIEEANRAVFRERKPAVYPPGRSSPTSNSPALPLFVSICLTFITIRRWKFWRMY
ncbi:MAG: hypothetical protein HC888_01910 [Candidatus Competibacteraceae bacterium]|nr:hypothetical protein [Candidatus Competibacteraceae bacterium]